MKLSRYVPGENIWNLIFLLLILETLASPRRHRYRTRRLPRSIKSQQTKLGKLGVTSGNSFLNMLEPLLDLFRSEEGRKIREKRSAETAESDEFDVELDDDDSDSLPLVMEEGGMPKYVCEMRPRKMVKSQFKPRPKPPTNHSESPSPGNYGRNAIRQNHSGKSIFPPKKGREAKKLPKKSELQLEIEEQERGADKYLESIEEKMSRLCFSDSVKLYEDDTSRKSKHAEGAESSKSESQEDSKENEEGGEEFFYDFEKNVTDTINLKFPLWPKFKNTLLRKEIRLLIKEGQGSMSDEDFDRFNQIKEEMDTGFKKLSVCKYKDESCDCANKVNCDYKLDPEISLAIDRSRDPEELEYYFTAWHDAAGSSIKPKEYEEFISLSNVYAQGNGFPDNVAMWADSYNEYTPNWTPLKFKSMILTLWNELKPFYKILHAYVRMQLSKFPPYTKLIKRCGLIPVHLLGNMFGQSWTSVDNLTRPYPDAPSLDASEEMRRQNYTPKYMLQLADKFFVSLGLKKLPQTFWDNSVYVKPKNVESTCHPSAYDMCLGRLGADYRLSMCAVVSQKDFATMHHELGHIQYMMQFSNLRYAFRGAANPGFDESIGDVLKMSVTTPEHLQCYLGLNLGLPLDCDKDKQREYPVTETDINFLFITALESLAFFPFSISMDTFRWAIMEGKIKSHDYNNKWWELRKHMQGIIPPKPRSPEMFDPAAKIHTVLHHSYLSYFMSTILQFDFYESLCKAAGQYNPSDPKGKPLYKCDFTGSQKAGKLFANMLKHGSKQPWPKILRAMTGRDCITTQPFLNYFKPLFEKLKELVEKGGEMDCLEQEWF